MSSPWIFLASASPRRRELLSQIGVGVRMLSPEVDETPLLGESPEAYVRRLAIAKAEAVFRGPSVQGRGAVLGADTAVVAAGRILGKPSNREDGLAMLGLLSGRAHRVLTGVALVDGNLHYRLCESRVFFRPLSGQEADAYWATGEPADKAGAYAIQGLGAVFVSAIEGSYSGVMGLPLFETAELLRLAGIELLAVGHGSS